MHGPLPVKGKTEKQERFFLIPRTKCVEILAGAFGGKKRPRKEKDTRNS
jgi:hypothetical protein